MAKKGEKVLILLHGEIKTPSLSREARLETGFFLRKLQQGELLSMPQVETDADNRLTLPPVENC